MKWIVQLAICVLTAATAAQAEQYSGHTVTILVPYAAGGPTDQLARQLAPALADKLKQTVIVENVSGGGTLIATGRLARAAPDGHTLLLHNLQISANVSLYANIPFDTENDLTPVIFINQNPLVLAGRKTLAPNTLPELIGYMKGNDTKIAYPGVGATGHLATSLLLKEAQLKGTLVPYRAAAPALQDLLGGHVDLFFATPQSVMALAAAGSVKVYGITAREKSPQFPAADSFVQTSGRSSKSFTGTRCSCRPVLPILSSRDSTPRSRTSWRIQRRSRPGPTQASRRFPRISVRPRLHALCSRARSRAGAKSYVTTISKGRCSAVRRGQMSLSHLTRS